ncbi:vancomycin resistance protein YoaR [Fontibacillus phaseoli]|uniref:Vancomycin resistance protein YoaR n=1 Tax=Fontibacillus phaseoli TaxID=1416533 RepID=A0A369BCA2_9BACL|nr:VanW family protein [Fontibacillus phaseoli]RCX19041.1 vancomycin resistance protein YoaR [Fontibacillus phaseoli]
MRRTHLFVIGAALMILTASFVYGGLWLYASRDSVPSGTKVGGLELGGLSAEEALERLDSLIDQLKGQQIKFTLAEAGHAENGEILTWGKTGVSWDAPNFRTELMSLSAGKVWERAKARKNFAKTWTIQSSFNPAVLKRTLSPAWEKKHFGSPVNAVRSIGEDDVITYLPGQPAQRIHWESLAVLVQAAVPGMVAGSGARAEIKPLDIVIPLTLVQPAVTVESLQREGVRRKIAEFSTGLRTSGAGRLHNVDATARSIDGMVLPPGGIFDYAKVVEAAEQSYGFREAPVIFGGKLVPGVGGGICQVSSTLYNAAILAGLDMVERRNHSLPVSYVPLGQDATFAQGYINFRFQNTSGHHLLIAARVEDGRLGVKLFGDIPDNVSYGIESRMMDILSAPDKYVKNSSLSAGSREVILQGKPGYIVETYRIKYVDGKPAAKTRLSRDTYPAQPNVIAVAPDAGEVMPENEVSGNEVKSGKAPTSKEPAVESRPPVLEDGVTGPRFP